MLKNFKMWKRKNVKRRFREISYEDIKKDKYILVDVRSRKEYLEGHLDGAINISLFNLKKEFKNKINENDKIVVYCQSGIRSKKALKILEDIGYKNVYNLTGGIENI